eukprot:NODE_151_length_2912_cov_34.591023_g109_i1.p1 GENE.NODE_151_length_2912_cov_34.591023_g109_i1~~NODE_151_length_2912_cov_34.591023_g109_i1.p1  ORF type:complete len:434 (-),score=114.83 NODE_151_length_2912_cov_34.591023_g109_i1:49-1350(-)
MPAPDPSKHYEDGELDSMKKGELLSLCDALSVNGGHTVGTMRAALKEHFSSGAPPSKKPKASIDPKRPKDADIDGKWQWQCSGSFTDYPSDTSAIIEEAYVAGKGSVQLPPQRNQTYVITFDDMQQTNTSVPPYKKRLIRRVGVDTNLPTSAPPPGAAIHYKPKPKPPAFAPPSSSTSESRPASPHSPSSHKVGPNIPTASADELAPPLESATFTLTPVEKDSEEFWELEEQFNAHLQGRNEDYVSKRLEKKQKPISFVMKGAEKIHNSVLEKRFAIRKAKMAAVCTNKQELRERVCFHGSHPKNLPSICKTSLLRFKHPLNPCKAQVDDGYFGTNKKGVYVSRYADYTFKYANRIVALEPGETCKIIMFRTLPGRSKHIPKLVGAIDPTEGYDSHSSPSFLEWYLFNEDQLCPDYVITVLAKEDTRTASDDM